MDRTDPFQLWYYFLQLEEPQKADNGLTNSTYSTNTLITVKILVPNVINENDLPKQSAIVLQ